jgi:hypothetical protein
MTAQRQSIIVALRTIAVTEAKHYARGEDGLKGDQVKQPRACAALTCYEVICKT